MPSAATGVYVVWYPSSRGLKRTTAAAAQDAATKVGNPWLHDADGEVQQAGDDAER